MSKIYNLKQEKNLSPELSIEQLSELKMTHKHDRRKNEILNGFVFMIGLVGFIVVFMLPRDGVYSQSSLENSFSNSSPLASSSLSTTNYGGEEEKAEEVHLDKHFKINGFLEAGEVLEFELENYLENSEVVYTVHFGNGETKEIKNKNTYYKYPASGNFVVNVTANYHDESKEIFSEKISIDEAIIVNSEAFEETD